MTELAIQFTTTAIQHIHTMIQKKPGSVGFRLSVKKTGCSGFAYVPEIIESLKDGDVALNNHPIPIFIDSKSVTLLQDITVDYLAEPGDVLKQKRLVFINPKEAGRCGCGESFTI
jgi:iron-sulfur cluster assembly protein